MKYFLLIIIVIGIIFTIFAFGFSFTAYGVKEWSCEAYRTYCEWRYGWDILAISFASGAATFLIYNVYKKIQWENDIVYLFIQTRKNRARKKIKERKSKMQKELSDDN